MLECEGNQNINESTDVLMPRWQRKKNSADHMIMLEEAIRNNCIKVLADAHIVHECVVVVCLIYQVSIPLIDFTSSLN